MAKPRKGNFIYRIFWNLTHSPAEILRVGQWIVLGLVLLGTLVSYGGFVAYGEPMLGLTKGLLVLTALHALYGAFRERRPQVGKEWFVLVPFVLWVLVGLVLVSPARERGWLMVLPWLQALAVFWMLCNSIRNSRDVHWLVGTVLAVVAVALLAGFGQFYAFPDWMVAMERERVELYRYGAGGFLLDPVNLGGLLVLVLPLAAGLMRFGRYSGPVRILSGFLALVFAVGLLVTTQWWGLMVGIVVILALPFLVVERAKNRMRTYGWGLVVLAVLAPLLWFGTQTLQDRVAYYAGDEAEDSLGATSREVAMAAFGSRPLTGYGPGSFEFVWERFVDGGAAGQSRYAVSLYGDLLAETGLVGLVLLAIPVLWLVGRGAGMWRATPYFRFKKEVEERMKRTSKRHQRSQRRERNRKEGRTPAAKVLLGGVVPGLVAWLVYAFRDYGHRLPLILLVVVLLLVVLATVRQWGEHVKSPPQDRKGLWISLVPLLLVGFTAMMGPKKFQAQHFAYLGEERLAAALAEPERIFARPDIPLEVERLFQLSMELNAGKSGAYRGIGEAILARHHTDLEDLGDLGEAALPYFEASFERNASSWRTAFGKARALFFTRQAGEQAAEALDQALLLAPYRVEVLTLHAARQLRGTENNEKGEAMLKRALAANPDYGPAVRLDTQYRSGALSGLSERQHRSFLRRMAKSLDPELARPERVEGAGRLGGDQFMQAIQLF